MKTRNRLYRTVYDRDPDIFTIKIIMPDNVKFGPITELNQWADQNLKGGFDFDIKYIWFELEEDAVLFRLTWE